MDEKFRLLFAIQQIDNITELTKENEYKQFLYGHLISAKVELQRQLSNLTHREQNL
jgi:hypothetical protein